MKVPVAKNADGSPITGIVRSELTTPAHTIPATPTTTLNLSSGWFTAMITTAYPTVSTDNRTPLADGFLPELTVRAHEHEPRVKIPNTEWSFGACGHTVTTNGTQICYPAGFKVGHLYELTHRAKDPLVLGFAAARGQKAISSAPVTVTDPGHTHTTTPASPVVGTNSAVQSDSNTLI